MNLHERAKAKAKADGYRVHAGITPYCDESGNQRASYQALNADGQAEATVEIFNGRLVNIRSLPNVDMGWFITECMADYGCAKEARL